MTLVPLNGLASPFAAPRQGRAGDPQPHPEPCGLLRIEFVFEQARVFLGREKKTDPQKKSQAVFFKTQVLLQVLTFEGQFFFADPQT